MPSPMYTMLESGFLPSSLFAARKAAARSVVPNGIRISSFLNPSVIAWLVGDVAADNTMGSTSQASKLTIVLAGNASRID